MAVDTSQLLLDAQCILSCVPPGMVEASQLSQLAALGQATVVTTAAFAVSTDGVQILSDNSKRRMAVVQNISAGGTHAFLGPSTVTTSGSTQGMLLNSAFSGNPLSQMVVYSTSALFAASAGVAIRVIEFSMP